MKCCGNSGKKRTQGYDLFIISQQFRFSAQELLQYQDRFNRIAKGKEMTLKQFRKSMGLLGLKSTSELADRIFRVMDKNNNLKVSFEEFLAYMDIVMHGSKVEKCVQSFKLIAGHKQYITYQEFFDWLKSMWMMSNKLVGTEVKNSEEKIRQIFTAIDLKKDGVIDFDEYSASTSTQSPIFSWCNRYSELDPEPESVMVPEVPTVQVDEYRQRIESIEFNIQTCIDILKLEEQNLTLPPIQEDSPIKSLVPERGPVCLSQTEQSHNGDLDSPTDFEENISLSLPIKKSKTVTSSIILDRLQGLSMKIEKLKSEEEKTRGKTIAQNALPIQEHKKKNKISWGDEDWSLILYMMLGIQKSVYASTEIISNLLPEHFQELTKFDLIPRKQTKVNTKKSKFRNFAPGVFARIRRVFNIDDKAYLKSLGVEKIMASLLQSEFSSLVGLVSSGKSGSFFYFSDDGKYVLKTMSLDECTFFRAILPEYYEYIYENPGTLIPKFFGFHNIKHYTEIDRSKKDFIIMENLFSSGYEIHMRFDLKGSTVGRATDANEDFSVARKDLDFNRSGIKIRLTPGEKKTIIDQVRKDSAFFERLGIIDYSLLVGIHNLKGKIPNIQGLSHAYISSDKQFLYFIGIIDVLTEYNVKKKLENIFKSPFLGKDISCIPPKPYADRFFKYMLTIFE